MWMFISIRPKEKHNYRWLWMTKQGAETRTLIKTIEPNRNKNTRTQEQDIFRNWNGMEMELEDEGKESLCG